MVDLRLIPIRDYLSGTPKREGQEVYIIYGMYIMIYNMVMIV